MIELIIMIHLLIGLGTSRYIRTHKYAGIDFKPIYHPTIHSTKCNEHAKYAKGHWGSASDDYRGHNRICIIESCRKGWTERHDERYFVLFSAPIIWPIYWFSWFILTPSILPVRDNIAIKTEQLRLKNAEQLKEIELIESKIKSLN